jgi:hypothetical protein
LNQRFLRSSLADLYPNPVFLSETPIRSESARESALPVQTGRSAACATICAPNGTNLETS